MSAAALADQFHAVSCVCVAIPALAVVGIATDSPLIRSVGLAVPGILAAKARRALSDQIAAALDFVDDQLAGVLRIVGRVSAG
jgi:hypothetical protein